MSITPKLSIYNDYNKRVGTLIGCLCGSWNITTSWWTIWLTCVAYTRPTYRYREIRCNRQTMRLQEYIPYLIIIQLLYKYSRTQDVRETLRHLQIIRVCVRACLCVSKDRGGVGNSARHIHTQRRQYSVKKIRRSGVKIQRFVCIMN